MHYCAKPIEKAWKVTAFTHSWLSIKSIMSWAKSSASAGLGGVYTGGGSKGGVPVGGVSDA